MSALKVAGIVLLGCMGLWGMNVQGEELEYPTAVLNIRKVPDLACKSTFRVSVPSAVDVLEGGKGVLTLEFSDAQVFDSAQRVVLIAFSSSSSEKLFCIATSLDGFERLPGSNATFRSVPMDLTLGKVGDAQKILVLMEWKGAGVCLVESPLTVESAVVPVQETNTTGDVSQASEAKGYDIAHHYRKQLMSLGLSRIIPDGSDNEPILPPRAIDPLPKLEFEVVRIPSPKRMSDAFSYQVLVHSEGNQYWIVKTGGFAGVNELYGPGKISEDEKSADQP